MNRAVWLLIAGASWSCGNGGGGEPETPDPKESAHSEVCRGRANARLVAEYPDAASDDAPVMRAQEPFTDAEKVLDELAPDLIRCRGYHSTIDACVIMQARVSKAGTVVAAEPYVHDGMPPPALDCLADVLRKAHFAGGQRDGTLLVPVTFVANKRWAR